MPETCLAAAQPGYCHLHVDVHVTFRGELTAAQLRAHLLAQQPSRGILAYCTSACCHGALRSEVSEHAFRGGAVQQAKARVSIHVLGCLSLWWGAVRVARCDV